MHNLEISKNLVNKRLIYLKICRSGPRVTKFLFWRQNLIPQMKIWVKGVKPFFSYKNTVLSVYFNFLNFLQVKSVWEPEHWRPLVFNKGWCLLSFEGEKKEMAMEAILLMFLSILWLTSITHNSSIDIASCPMDPLTWFNVSWNASYIMNSHRSIILPPGPGVPGIQW